MKTIYLLLLAAFISLDGAAQQTGINFKSGKWSEMLAQAKAEDKLIFVDVYTDWCGPCKAMDEEVFPKKMVGDKFNASFINYKLDAEKGEGPEVAKRYLVKSYPNYLFVNGDGVLIYRSTSRMSPIEFIQEADNALSERKQEQTIVQLDLLYPERRADKTFMYNYLSRRTTLRLDNADLLDEYIALLSPEERGELKNLQLIMDNGMYIAKNVQLGIALETLKLHKDKFSLLKNKYNESLDGVAGTATATTLRKAIAKRDEKLLAKVLELKPDQQVNNFHNKQSTLLEYYLGTGDRAKYLSAAKDYVNNFLMKIPLTDLAKSDSVTMASQRKYILDRGDIKENIEEIMADYRHTQTIQLTNNLNDIAKNVAAFATKPADLKMTQKWSDYALKITTSDVDYYKNVYPFYVETNAIIRYKVGDRKVAITHLESMLAKLKNKKADEYFAPLLAKMKANETL